MRGVAWVYDQHEAEIRAAVRAVVDSDRRRLKQAGVTSAGYRALIKKAGGLRCQICGYDDTSNPKVFPQISKAPNGKPRGILCRKCALRLGQCGDELEWLLRAAEFLAEV